MSVVVPAEFRKRTADYALRDVRRWAVSAAYYFGLGHGKTYNDSFIGEHYSCMGIRWSIDKQSLELHVERSGKQDHFPYERGGIDIPYIKLLNETDLKNFGRSEDEFMQLIFLLERELNQLLPKIGFKNAIRVCQSSHHNPNYRLAECAISKKRSVCEKCKQIEEEEKIRQKQAEKTLAEQRAAIAAAERAKMAPSRRLRIMQRDNFHCVFCGRGREDGIKLHKNITDGNCRLQAAEEVRFLLP